MSSYSFSPSDECSLFADCTFRHVVQYDRLQVSTAQRIVAGIGEGPEACWLVVLSATAATLSCNPMLW